MDYAPYIIAFLAWIPSLLALWRQSKKDKADIASTLVNDAIKLKDEIKEQKKDTDEKLKLIKKDLATAQSKMVLLEESVKSLSNCVTDLREGVGILTSQIESLGHTPKWIPKDKKTKKISKKVSK